MFITNIDSMMDEFDISQSTEAPLRLAKSVWLRASQEKIFAIVSSPIEMPRLFPWVQNVTVDSSQAEVEGGVGTRRCCNFGEGMVLEETIVGWNPPRMVAYRCQDETNPFGLRSHLGLVTCRVKAEEGTILTWRQYFDHPNPPEMVEKLDNSLSIAFQRLVDRFGGSLLEHYLNTQSS